jgi:hypothetical protein
MRKVPCRSRHGALPKAAVIAPTSKLSLAAQVDRMASSRKRTGAASVASDATCSRRTEA